MGSYNSIEYLPPIVREALDMAERMGLKSSCSVEVGRLLRVLAAQFREGILGEIGAGCGVGTAWLASELAPGTRLITVERDEPRAGAVSDLFGGVSNVEVLHGDWHHILEYGPFDMLFVDAAEAKRNLPDQIVRSLRPGGLVVLDDFTPEDLWPLEWVGNPDPVREFWLNDHRLAATEILVTNTSAVILATRRS